MRQFRFFAALMLGILVLTGCGASSIDAVIEKIEKNQSLTEADYDVIYDYVMDRIDDFVEGAKDDDAGQLMEVFSDKKFQQIQKVLPPGFFDQALPARMFGLDVPRSSIYPEGLNKDVQEVQEEEGVAVDSSVVVAACVAEDLTSVEAEVDTMLMGNYTYYAGGDQNPMARLIKERGATEISQGKNRHSFETIVLPARIARVAKGAHERNINKIQQILKNDIIGYFELENIYDTPLKRKHFETDENSKWFIDEFNTVKKELSEQIFCVTMPILDNYDVEAGTFTIKFPYNQFSNARWANQLAAGLYVAPDTELIDNSKVTVSVNEDTAIKIENNECNFVILGNIAPELRRLSQQGHGTAVEIDNAMIFVPSEFYIADNKDGNILYSGKF